MLKGFMYLLWVLAVGTMVTWVVMFVKEQEAHYISYWGALVAWFGLLVILDFVPDQKEGESPAEE